MKKQLFNWIEIPVANMERAKKFYSAILGDIRLTDYPMEDAEVKYSVFPGDSTYSGGALIESKYAQPSPDGVTVYLDGGEDMSDILNKVANEGGSILMPKTNMGPEVGYIGLFIDSEGNKIGLQHN